MGAVVVEHQNLAVFQVADVLRTDDVQRAGLGGEDRAAVQLAENQRPNAQRIAGADQLLVGETDEGVRALEHTQPLDESIDEPVAVRAGNEVKDHLGVCRRLHHGAFAHELAAQRQAVGEIAVVADGKTAGIQFSEQRLHIAQDGLAGRRIAHMADGGVAREAIDHLSAGKGVTDEPEPALGVKARAVERNDAGGFLAAML